MSAPFSIGVVCVFFFILLSSSTTAFHALPSNVLVHRSSAVHTGLYRSRFEAYHPIRFFSPLYSSPAIEIAIEDGNNNSTKIAVIEDTDLSWSDRLRNLAYGNGIGKFSVTKESMSALGLNVLLAYGFVSNFSYITCLILAWVTHGKSTGLSPLVPGQWKKFLLVYAGFFAANNMLRPLRFSFSLAITPIFDTIIDKIQSKTSWSRRTSTGLTIFLINICGTFTYLFAGLFLATTFA